MKQKRNLTLALVLSASLIPATVLADSPEGHMTDGEANPWQGQAGTYGQPMNPQQMEMMRRQQMMQQGGPGMGPGHQGGMMDPQMMQMMRQQRMQMMQQGDPGMAGGPGMQGGPGSQHRGGMMPPMMKEMMKKRDRHWQQVEQRLANIESLLQQLVELQKK